MTADRAGRQSVRSDTGRNRGRFSRGALAVFDSPFLQLGGVVVAEFLDEGHLHHRWDVPVEGDPLQNIAHTYYQERIPPSVFQPISTPHRGASTRLKFFPLVLIGPALRASPIISVVTP